MRHFLSLYDLGPDEFVKILSDAAAVKKDRNVLGKPLLDKQVALIFEKPSTRTRISFQVGIKRLGGNAIVLSNQDLQISRGESLKDTARVLSRYCDAIMVRTFSHDSLVELAEHSSIPVINGLTDLYHPCQGLADFQTIQENNLEFEKSPLCYLGDANNNVCHSLILACALAKSPIRIGCPPEFRPDAKVLAVADSLGADYKIFDRAAEAAAGAAILYVDVWVSMGQEKTAAKRKKVLAEYQLNAAAIDLAAENAIVLHCLPAHLDEEITEEVFEGPQSRVFDQAENRLHSQMALMAHLI